MEAGISIGNYGSVNKLFDEENLGLLEDTGLQQSGQIIFMIN